MLEKDRYKNIARLLKLEKPLVIFDLKTTGPGISSDKIIEIAYIKINPNGRTISDDFLLNPQIPVSEISISLHGLNNADLDSEKTFREKAVEIRTIFEHCCYAGYNTLNFDLPILRREFIRVGMNFDYSPDDIIDIRVIVNHLEPRNLATIYKLICNKEHENDHVAQYDVQVSAEILEKQLEKYSVLKDKDLFFYINQAGRDEAVDKFYWKDGEAYFSFSKYKNQPLSKVAKEDPEFLKECLKNNFAEGNNKLILKALKK